METQVSPCDLGARTLLFLTNTGQDRVGLFGIENVDHGALKLLGELGSNVLIEVVIHFLDVDLLDRIQLWNLCEADFGKHNNKK